MDLLSGLFSTSDFPARWTCGRWSSAHGWLHIASDVAIFAAYVSIPCILIYFLRKRSDLPFPRILWLFSAFILTCGLGHLVEATLFWQPWYRFSGVLKALTAVTSWATVIALAPTVRKALALPGLAVVNARLEQEIAHRKQTEEDLRRQAELLNQDNAELEAFTSSVVLREERIIELKQEINELLAGRGQEPRYTLGEPQAG